jgi:molybdenum cofactor cytidylyltransferase
MPARCANACARFIMTTSAAGTVASGAHQPDCTLGAVILAAGGSSRLGQPKQLVLYKGRPLLVKTVEAVLAAQAAPVVVVLGAHAEKIRPFLESFPVVIVENPAWAKGMSSSLRAGLAALEAAAPGIGAVLIALCDQPHFSERSVARLRAALGGGKTIAATRHGENAGVPAIFIRSHFHELHALTGAEGARAIIAAHAATTACVDLPELVLDIDTPSDLARLAEQQS